MHDTEEDMMLDFIKTLISETKELESGEMVYILFFSIICFILDLFFIRFLTNSFWLQIFRSMYFTLGYFSHLFVSNRIFKHLRLKKEEVQRTKNIKEALKNLTNDEYSLMYKFAQNNCVCLDIETDEEIEAALCLKSMFDFIRFENSKIFIKPQYLDVIVQAYFPLINKK